MVFRTRAVVLVAVLAALCVAVCARTPSHVLQPSSSSSSAADVRACTEFGIVCDCVLACDHGTQEGDACADAEMASEVCRPGSVQVDAWLARALRTQRIVQRDVPINYGQLLGTHNSCISKAYGYGLGEERLTALIRSLFPSEEVRVANQALSVTDQLAVGIRQFEIDTHYFHDALRVGHCGGVHIKALNDFVQWLSKLLGRQVDFDSELLGCFSDKSVLVTEIFGEMQAFLGAPQNADEILIVMFDDQEDLLTWDEVPNLVSDIQKYFGTLVFTPTMKRTLYPNRWPSQAELVARGTRIVFASCTDYGTAMDAAIFFKYGPLFANWTEYDTKDLVPYPACKLQEGTEVDPTLTGRILRVNGDTLVYGPFWNGSSDGFFTPENVFDFLQCGVNWPCMDQSRPELSEHTIWTWDAKEPAALSGVCPYMGVGSDGRWRTTSQCSAARRYPCKSTTASPPLFAPSLNAGPWLAPGANATSVQCSAGFAYALPANGFDNQRLYEAVSAVLSDVWLPFDVSQLA